MNKLGTDKQTAIVSALVEGVSIRSIERMTGVHRDTIMRLMVRVGQGCERIMDRRMRDLPCKHLELDEIWCYVGKKQRHVKECDDPNQVGDFYTWVAIDSATKLIPAYKVGKRDAETGQAFVDDWPVAWLTESNLVPTASKSTWKLSKSLSVPTWTMHRS
jgi:hypothetical protein